MYRDDREAIQRRADALTREANQLRAENDAIRAAVASEHAILLPTSLPPGAVYRMDVRGLPLGERARLAAHSVRRFPVWLVGVLNVMTLGLFSLIHFGLILDRLPRAAHNDPSGAKAIGFQFIPWYHLYWIFFNSVRLCDRLNLQLRLRNQPARAPKGMMIAASIFTVIPYVGLIALPVLWTIAACLLQSPVNAVAGLAPSEWDATPSPYDETGQPAAAGGAYAPSDDQVAAAHRARRLVRWSNVLGWGGLALLFGGPVAGGGLFGAAGAAVVALVAVACVIAGAIVGQIGRGLQGRAI